MNKAKLFQILKDNVAKVLHSMSANLENSAVVTGLEKVSFHFNPKEEQSQRMFKLLQNCAHFIYQQGNAQNPSSQASAVHGLINSRYTSWIQKRHTNQRSNCQHPLNHRRSQEFQKNIYFCFTDYIKIYAWTARRSNQSTLKEINPEVALEGPMLKLQYSTTSCREPTGKDPYAGKEKEAT